MPDSNLTLAIDAQPRGPDGLFAASVILGRPMLVHLIDLATTVGAKRIVIHGSEQDRGSLERLAEDRRRPEVSLVTEAVSRSIPTLRTDRLYDRRRLRRAIVAGGNLDAAVLWRLDVPEGLKNAEAELLRRTTYQPLGHVWAWPMARSLARALQPTWVRPNMVTFASAGAMCLAAALIAFSEPSGSIRLVTAALLALGLVLDTADGHLARLQGTTSELGRWLDAVLDETVDMLLHAAIAWSAFDRDGWAGWLVLGMTFGMGKYVFRVASDGPENEASLPEAIESRLRPNRVVTWPRRLRSVVRWLGHADVRWHLWIFLGLLGCLDLELILFAGYFPARAIASVVRKGVRVA
jgi:phosphatidylglycerophosphate synthase